MRVSTKSVMKSIEKKKISGSIWHKSFNQTAKYSLFEDRSIYQSLYDAAFIFLLGKVLSVSARVGESIIITVYLNKLPVITKTQNHPKRLVFQGEKISGSIWHKSFIQTVKYSPLEDRSFYRCFYDATLSIFLKGKVLSEGMRRRVDFLN